MTRVLLAAGLLAGPLFVATFLVEGVTRAGYDPMRLPVSLLAVGDGGWAQGVNFIVDGLLVLAFAIGLHRALRESVRRQIAGPVVIAVFAIGLIAAGLFSTDPAGGFPPGVLPPRDQTTASTLHDLASVMVFGSLPIACFVLARHFGQTGDRTWAAYSTLTGAALVIVFVLMLIAFNGSNALSTIGGLIQRVWIVAGWGWLLSLAARMLWSDRSRAGY